MKIRPITLIVFLLTIVNLPAQETRVTASVDSDSVGVQDQFEFSITVSGKDSGDAEAPRMQSLRNFRVVSGPSVSTQFQWVNGRTSSSKSFTYILIPEKEGQFTVDPVEVRVGDKVYKTQPLQVRVTSAPRTSPPRRQRPLNPLDPFEPFEAEESRGSEIGTEAVFVRAELDRSSVYPGQQVTLEYQVYTRVGISRFQLRESPPLSGFWVEDLEVEREPKPVRKVYNGREYLVFTVKKQALFPTNAGSLKIPSSIFAISAETSGGFFGVFGRTETLFRKSQELSLAVKPLPVTGRPPEFSNAVGSFHLSTGIDKKQAATGEAVALQVKLEGKGNLKMIPDIPVPSLPDFTVYSSKRADAVRPSADGQVRGNKTWEYVIVPKSPGQHTIPPLSFSFFDAEQEKYETATTSPITLTVVRGIDSDAITGLSGSEKQDVVRRGTDISFIKLSAGDLEKAGNPLYQSLWLYVIAAIPLAFNVGIVVYQKTKSVNAQGAGSIRSRKARRIALDRLKAAGKQGKTDPRRFYDQAASALSGYLSDRFSFNEIELTGDNLERALSPKSVPPEIVEETRACLQECDFGRFVSASGSAEKMRQLTERIQRNIDSLERTRFSS